MTTMTSMMLKMNIQKPKTFYFNPPLLNVEAIQLQDMWVSSNSYFIFCDAIDSNFSLTNLEKGDEPLIPAKLIGLFPRGLGEMFKTDKSIVSKLTITIKERDLTEPERDEVAILNLKIYHD